MGMKVNNYAVNQADKGTIIYGAGEQIKSVSIIIKGRVQAVNNGSKVLLGSGNFIGVADLFSGQYINTYTAYDEVLFYCFPVQSTDELAEVFTSNKDYKGLMAASLTRYVSELEKAYHALKATAEQLYHFIDKNNRIYTDTGNRLGYPVTLIPSIKDIELYDSDYTIDERKLDYYKECAKIPVDIWKSFCSSGDTVTLYLVEETAELASQLISECGELTEYIKELFFCLMNNSEECLFKCFATLAISIDEKGGYSGDVIKIIDSIIDQINIVEKTFEEKVGHNLEVERKRMEEIYYFLLSKSSNRKEQMENNFKYTESEVKEVTEELKDSLAQILNYSGQSKEKSEEFKQAIVDYINLKDKMSTDDTARVLRKKLMVHFYEVYELVFLKSCTERAIPKVIDLFLKYAYMDERMLSGEQLRELYYIDEEEEDFGSCPVYNIKSWLTCILKGEKEPSKNEFDQDYVDMLREKKKRGEITIEEEKQALENPVQKVLYEMRNMFRYNHRLVNGQISTFVPFLFGDNVVKGFKTLLATKRKVNEAVNELLEIDYSIFHREILYVNPEKKIVKEYIMKQVFPDIILLPTVGYNGVMWQEITGKRKSNEGRFMLPVFIEGSLKDILVKLFGKFRWELCRTIQGTAWNNIKEKSLTSEYADYIQFYRKNRDLSEEMKEKLKAQIQKGRSNYREVFVIDYEAWVKSEANGGLRLNKVARGILATYCPFSRPIRDRIKGQPLFADAMERNNRNNLKKVKDLDLRYRALEKEGAEITEELKETYVFYKEL